MLKSPKILLQGVGGIGGCIAGKLIQHNFDVSLLTGNIAITNKILLGGLIVTQDSKETIHEIVDHVWTNADEIPSTLQFDMLIISVQLPSLRDAIKQSISVLTSDGFVLLLQNGFPEKIVGHLVPSTKLLSGVVSFGGHMEKPGVYYKKSDGVIHVGEIDGTVSERIQKLAKILSVVEKTEITSNIEGLRWSKLAINCSVNPLGALTGQNVGDLMMDRVFRSIFLKAYSEVIDIAKSKGIKLSATRFNPELYYCSPHSSQFVRFWKHVILRLHARRKYAHTRSSTYTSLLLGKPTEIKFFNGFAIQEGRNVGLEVTVNKMLLKAITLVEEGKLSIGTASINWLKLSVKE